MFIDVCKQSSSQRKQEKRRRGQDLSSRHHLTPPDHSGTSVGSSSRTRSACFSIDTARVKRILQVYVSACPAISPVSTRFSNSRRASILSTAPKQDRLAWLHRNQPAQVKLAHRPLPAANIALRKSLPSAECLFLHRLRQYPASTGDSRNSYETPWPVYLSPRQCPRSNIHAIGVFEN